MNELLTPLPSIVQNQAQGRIICDVVPRPKEEKDHFFQELKNNHYLLSVFSITAIDFCKISELGMVMISPDVVRK